jgi:hypothetical protein
MNASNTLVLCYYIIKHLSLEDGIKYVHELTDAYGNRSHGKTLELTEINKLLAFHFRPRGSHTKGASNEMK